ncbi:MAG TPA: hypothetical protein VL137_17725 [Polyangiaceae bacterium]|jgi:hypothetical protein|nr:hypothetical protein [Polyangiaceae bacterium]
MGGNLTKSGHGSRQSLSVLAAAGLIVSAVVPAKAAEPSTDNAANSGEKGASEATAAEPAIPAGEAATAADATSADASAAGSGAVSGAAADANAAASTDTGGAAKAEGAPTAKTEPAAPLASGEPGWKLGFQGFVELDGILDSTQSFSETMSNNTIARPNTIAGDNPRMQWTARDSRLGFKVEAPEFESMKASALLEMDFFGTVASNATQDQSYVAGPIRLRQFYTKLETPIVDVLAGQTQDLYGWGGSGFFPNTPAFLGVLGEVFHRNPQLRLTKVIDGDALGLEAAVAATRPATRDSGAPDLQAGLKLSVNGWKGASAQGPRRAKPAPMAVGVSGVGRRMAVTDFSAVPGDPQVAHGWGAVAQAFVPIIPARGQNLSNTVSVTGEFSLTDGATDLYNTLTGGVLFPALPNPHNTLPAPAYSPNIDQGIVTFDANSKVHTIKWQGLVVNLHYHFPFREGKLLSISGTYSQIKSSNALQLTPTQGRPFVWDKGRYIDATIWCSITPAFQVALSGQTMTQTFGDGVKATNNRGEISTWFFY